MTGAPRTLVIVPTYNERENLPGVVEQLMVHGNVSLLVVDDGSPDGTGALADELARARPGRMHVLHRSGRRGLGRSYIDGIRWALEQPYDRICQMDADLSHDPARVPALVGATANADIAIGSRYVDGGAVVNWPLRRRLLSRFANAYVRTITRLTVHDCTAGFRCWRRDALAALPLDRFRSEGYSFLVEMLYAAASLGKRIVEVPITFVERREGVSKMSTMVMLESAVTPWRLIARRGQGSFHAMV